MRRYILTGSPGAGKTTILTALRDRGYAVVGEAATDVIDQARQRGETGPPRGPGFLDAIVRLQRRRENFPAPPAARIRVFDRSPICTLALARYLEEPVTPTLAREVDRVLDEKTYERSVFFVRLLGFITPTFARRITLEQSQAFEEFHERTYKELGFELVEVSPGPVAERVDFVDRYIHDMTGDDA
jgi:predicted ATPase